MQYVQSSLETEFDFCRHRTGGLWEEYQRLYGSNSRIKRSLHHSSGVTGGMRRSKIRGAASYSTDEGVGGGSSSFNGGSSSCCSCGVGSAGMQI